MYTSARPAHYLCAHRLLISLTLATLALLAPPLGAMAQVAPDDTEDWLHELWLARELIQPPRIVRLSNQISLDQFYYEYKLRELTNSNELLSLARKSAKACSRKLAHDCVAGYLASALLDEAIHQ